MPALKVHLVDNFNLAYLLLIQVITFNHISHRELHYQLLAFHAKEYMEQTHLSMLSLAMRLPKKTTLVLLTLFQILFS
jgi:hypothetical protein